MTDDLTPVVSALKKSGFPLQTRIQHEINERSRSDWRVLDSEHPWHSEEGDQFIDVIANCGTVVLVIECKKAQDRQMVFLRPVGLGTTGTLSACRVWQFERNQGAGTSFGQAIVNLDLGPASYQAEFCVSTDNNQRLLEKDARPVVLASEALLAEQPPFPEVHLLGRSFLVPTIITTARLYTLRYAPSEIPLDTGNFDNQDLNAIEPIPWVRFHKTFTAHRGDDDRTVFVVNSAALPKFLDEISRLQGCANG